MPRSLARSGAFDLGVIAVGWQAGGLLERWADHCRTDCVGAPDDGGFVDQRWCDAASCRSAHLTVTDLGCGVAYWNVDERPLSAGRADRSRACGRCGCSTTAASTTGLRTSGAPIRETDHAPSCRSIRSSLRSSPTTPDGSARSGGQRRTLLRTVGIGPPAASRSTGSPGASSATRCCVDRATPPGDGGVEDVPTDPFAAADDRALIALLRSPLPGSPAPHVGRYLHHVYLRRADVRAAIPDLASPAGVETFFDWVGASGHVEEAIPAPLVPARRPLSSGETPPPFRRGVNIIGTAEAGDDRAWVLATLAELGEPIAVVDTSGPTPADRDIALVCVESDDMRSVVEQLAGRLRPDQYTIGLWMRQLDEPAPSVHVAAKHVDEVWVSSHEAAAALRRAIDRPVHVVPPSVPPMTWTSEPHHRVAGTDFTYLCSADAAGPIECTDAARVARSFCAAFRAGAGPTLVIAVCNADRHPTVMERLRYESRERADIHIVDASSTPGRCAASSLPATATCRCIAPKRSARRWPRRCSPGCR